MDEDSKEKFHAGLTEAFKSAEVQLNNKEIAALMGVVDPNNPFTLPGGLISKLGFTEAKIAQIARKKDKDKLIDFLLREVILKSISRLNEIISFHQKRIEEILEQIQSIDVQLEKLDHQHEVLERELEFFQAHGYFELNETGQLKDKGAEAIILAWEAKTGQAIDCSDLGTYETLLEILMGIEKQRLGLQHLFNSHQEEYEYRKEKLNEAYKIRDKLQSSDLAQINTGLLNFEKFINFKETGFEEKAAGQTKHARGKTELSKHFEPATENHTDEFSFGFPPLQQNFNHAVTDKAQADTSTPEKPQIPMKENCPIKPNRN